MIVIAQHFGKKEPQLVDPEGITSFDDACRRASEFVTANKNINFLVVKKQ